MTDQELDNTADQLARLQRSRHEKKAQAAQSANSGQPEGIEHFVGIRESDKNAHKSNGAQASEFTLMAEHTLDRSDVKILPGAQTIRSMAADLVGNDGKAQDLREQIGAVAVYEDHILVGYKIVIENTLYLLSLYSAAKVKIKETGGLVGMDNAYSLAVARLVNQHQIKVLHVGPFHRLVRHQKAMHDLLVALGRNKTRVIADGTDLDMGTDNGQDMFRINALAGEKQYIGAVAGLTNGWHGRLDRGQWPKSEGQLPAIGYKFRGENDPTPIPDLDKIQMIRDIITWAGDESLSDYDIAEKIAKTYGWVSDVKKSRKNQEAAQITDLKYPETAVRNLLKRGLPLWATGSYAFKTGVPYHLESGKLRPSSQERMEQLDQDTRQVTYDVSFHHELLPGGEWIDQASIAKAIKRLTEREEKNQGRAASNTDRKPLSSVAEWSAEGTQHALSARDSHNYILISRDESLAKNPDGTYNGWHDEDRNVLAVLNPEETHKALAEALIEAISETGMNWTRIGNTTVEDSAALEDSKRIDQLAQESIKIEKEILNAEFDYQLARETGSIETAKNRIVLIEKLRKDQTAIQERVAQAQSAATAQRLLSSEAKIDAGSVVATLAALAKTQNQAPAKLNHLMRQILTGMTLEVAENGLTVKITTKIKVETTDGTIILGPVSTSVTNKRRELKTARSSTLLEDFLANGLSLDEAMIKVGYKDREFARARLHQQLKDADVIPTKGLRSAIVDCPIVELRQVIWAIIQAKRTGKTFRVPKGINPAYAAHIRSVYTDKGMNWNSSWASDNPEHSRNAIELLQRNDLENGMRWDEILPAVAAGLTGGSTRGIEEELVRGKGKQSAATAKHTRIAYEPVLERDEKWDRHNKNRMVWIRKCSHCDTRTLTHILRVPEIPGGLICTTCRKAPELPTITFGPEYGKIWNGPRTLGKGKSQAWSTGTTTA
jgi:hypothetical protein